MILAHSNEIQLIVIAGFVALSFIVGYAVGRYTKFK